jgi:predicted secreted protein
LSLTILAATFLVTWWIVLFATLPWGVRTQEEDDSVIPGTAPSAPVRPLLLRKAAATTVISAAIVGLIYWLVTFSGLTIDTIPVLSDLGRVR